MVDYIIGQFFFKLKNYEKAEYYLTKSNNDNKYYYLGDVYFYMNKYENAIDIYKKNCLMGYNNDNIKIGDTYCKLEDYCKAIIYYSKAIEYQFYVGYFKKGFIYYILNNHNAAIDNFIKYYEYTNDYDKFMAIICLYEDTKNIISIYEKIKLLLLTNEKFLDFFNLLQKKFFIQYYLLNTIEQKECIICLEEDKTKKYICKYCNGYSFICCNCIFDFDKCIYCKK